MTTAQSLPGVENADMTKFLLVPAKNLLDLPDALRPERCCVSAETDNRSARGGFPFRAERHRCLKLFFRAVGLFFGAVAFLEYLVRNQCLDISIVLALFHQGSSVVTGNHCNFAPGVTFRQSVKSQDILG